MSQFDEPVDYSPMLSGRVANIVPVESIDKVTAAVNAYTQTIGIYPESLKHQLRDILPLFGAQRLTSLGYACSVAIAMPQDAIEPIRRMCKWIVDEECDPDVVIPLWRLGEPPPVCRSHDAAPHRSGGRRRGRPVRESLRHHRSVVRVGEGVGKSAGGRGRTCGARGARSCRCRRDTGLDPRGVPERPHVGRSSGSDVSGKRSGRRRGDPGDHAGAPCADEQRRGDVHTVAAAAPTDSKSNWRQTISVTSS